jgi:hypothetical protein
MAEGKNVNLPEGRHRVRSGLNSARSRQLDDISSDFVVVIEKEKM